MRPRPGLEQERGLVEVRLGRDRHDFETGRGRHPRKIITRIEDLRIRIPAESQHGERLAGCGALDDTKERARLFGQRAIDALGPFPAGMAKAALTEAVEFAIARAY